MVNPTRITVAFDKPTADLLEKISTEADVSHRVKSCVEP